MSTKLVCPAAIAFFLWASAFVSSPRLLHSQIVSSLAGDSVVSFRIRFGVTDTSETAWDGSVSVSNGDLLSVRDWHPRPENEMTGDSGWKLSTHKGINFRWRPWEKPPPFGPAAYYWAPGVIVDVKSSPSTRLDIQTKNGNFSFNPAELPAGRPAAFLEGAVVADRVPSAELLSTSQHQNDFASMLSGENGEVWVCWVAYRDKANEILARRFDGKQWGEIQKVSQQPADVYLAKMGRDGKGRPWVVSSEQVTGNWDLYGRSFEDGEWSSPMRLSNDAGPDIFPNLATDSGGGLWAVWQGFRDGQADIFARRYDGSRWSAEERISTSPANDWEPVIAADGEGAIYVAWDTYDKGNYDVVMRKHSRGEWSGVIVVADSPRYEAHVSLAADQQNRLWAAWNESGTNWGKDTGFSLNTEGTCLYEWRSIGVGVWDGKSWSEPVQDINLALPAELREYNDFPVLFPDAEGRMWLFARHRTLRQKDMQSETPAHRAAWEIWGSTLQGEQWTTPVHLPFTRGRQDVRWGLASDGRGALFAAWPTDNRDYEAFLFEHADVYAARLPAMPVPAEAPTLVPRVLSELTAYPIDPQEEKNLLRIREYTVESEGKSYHPGFPL